MPLSRILAWIVLASIAGVSIYISELVTLGGKHPIEASALAIVVGLAIRAWVKIPSQLQPGIANAEKALILGIVLLGVALNTNQLAQHGFTLLFLVIGIMALSFWVIFWLGKLFKLSESLALLLAVGTTICGTSAIAITAPLIKAPQEEVSYSVATVSLWGLVAILLYPVLGHLVGASDFDFGVFAGVAIHSTPQVVGAGYIYSDLSGQTATAIKLLRNCFMAPLAMLIALWWAMRARSNGETVSKVNIARAFPWFLFGYFLMAAGASLGYFTPAGIDAFTNAGKFLIIVGMAGIGLTTDFGAIRRVGFGPIGVGLLGTIFLALISAGLIQAFF